MPLPFLLIGAAVLAGGFGVKKGLDAKDDFDRAEALNNEARDIYDQAAQDLDKVRKKTNSALKSLGKLKVELYNDSLVPFVKAFSAIKDIDFQDKPLKSDAEVLDVSQDDMLTVERSALQMSEVLGGGAAALGAGGLAGLAAYGGVGMLGAASTTTAISTLSGAAATNATLAWLGGGAISTGGLGIAGGTAVLGGIVAGPVLAVGGMMMASKAEAAKENAYANRKKAMAAAEEMRTAQTITEGICGRVKEIHAVLEELNGTFGPLLAGLQKLVRSNKHYPSYSVKDRRGVMMAAAMAKTLKNVMEAPVLNKQGALATASRKALLQARTAMDEINSL
jgi:hypothetical protein